MYTDIFKYNVLMGNHHSKTIDWRSIFFIIATLMLEKSIFMYRKVSNIRRTLVGNKIVDHPDVVGASPVGAAPTTSSFST